MVSVAAPVVAFAAAVTVRVDVFPVVLVGLSVAVALVGLSVAVTPVGAPETASAIAPAKLLRVMFTVLVPVAPCATESVAGDMASVKPDAGAAVTTRLKLAVTAETPEPLAFAVME